MVQGNYRLTINTSDADTRHIILEFQGKPFPVLEGQSLGVIAPGVNFEGKAHLPRLYSVSSPRDGERAGYHNVSLTVKREKGGCAPIFCVILRRVIKSMSLVLLAPPSCCHPTLMRGY